MKNKFIVRTPNLLGTLLPAIGAGVGAIALAFVPITYKTNNPMQIILMSIPSVIAFALCLFFLYKTLKNNVHKLSITATEVVLSSFFGTVKRVSWTAIENVQVIYFNNLDGVKRGAVHIGGVDVFVPKQIPPKWIMFADIHEDFCESIYCFLEPNGYLKAIKVLFDQKILDAVMYFTDIKVEHKIVG